MDEPTYDSYSVDDLHDALRHVDRDQYPERLAAIEAELSSRETQANGPNEGRSDDNAPLTPSVIGLTRRAVSAYLGFAGFASFALTIDRISWHGGLFSILALVLLVVSFGGMAAAGVSVWKGWVPGIFFGSFAMGIQIPFVQIGKVGYTIAAIPSLEIQLSPMFGFAFSTGTVFTFFLHDSPQPFYLGLNVPAMLFTWVLAHYGMRRLDALKRLRNRDHAG
jgi:hypothetical protein